MTINIELRPDEERALRERARQSGRDVSELVKESGLIHTPGLEPHRRKSLKLNGFGGMRAQ
jgi:hypothetical protein